MQAKPTYQLLPSLLSADVTRLGDEVSAVMDAGADMIHFDVMDNHYVPNVTFGPLFCHALRVRFKTVPIDVHLMTSPVDALIADFAKAGASRISIHPDATIHLDRSLQLIKSLGLKAGLALNPSTSLEVIKWCLHRLDFVLIMTVNPGFGGQSLIEAILPKIEECHVSYSSLPICVDGGVTPENILSLAKAGATQFIAGSAIFSTNDYAKTITLFRNALK